MTPSNNKPAIFTGIRNFIIIPLSLLFILPLFIYGQLAKNSEITIEDAFRDYIFYPSKVSSFRSMNNGKNYTVLEGFSSIVEYDYKTGKMVSVAFSAKESKLKVTGYEFSKDERYILLTTGIERIYRHSFRAEYFLYDTRNHELKSVSPGGKQQLAHFSPDGKKVSFMRDNNLYITEILTMEVKQITFDGKVNSVINGAPDWVYEEEFTMLQAYTWSSDSKKVAFYRFDESQVKEYSLTRYGNLYPELYKYKYPKAGEQNSVVTIHVYDLETMQTNIMDTGKETDQYIGRIFWTRDPGTLCIIRLNRLQNQVDFLHADASTGKSNVVLSEKNEKYISEPTDHMIYYLPDNKHFIYLSERDGWYHLYLYNFISKSVKPITSGNYDVSDFLGYDEETGRIFYQSHESSPVRQDLYSITTESKMKTKLSKNEGWNIATFSENFQYYINNYSNANQPDYITLHSSDGKLIRVLENNEEVVKEMSDHNFVKIEFIKIPAAKGLDLNGFMLKPPGFDPRKKYPLFVNVYGGPESQDAIDQYSYGNVWLQMIAQKGYLVTCVDGRGTDSRGEAFRKSTYLELGRYETEDQIAAAKYFASLPYVDKSRIGIFGWSYGGFISLLCLEKGADIFKMAISVAPITNWRFYDTIYTERFMRKPGENPHGYDDNSPISHVGKIKGKLLLVHGMFDDNVHMQNSVELINELIRSNTRFNMLFYPGRNHGIQGGNASVHLYSAMTDFVIENL